MKKQIFSMLLALALSMTLLPTEVSAEGVENSATGNTVYTQAEDVALLLLNGSEHEHSVVESTVNGQLTAKCDTCGMSMAVKIEIAGMAIYSASTDISDVLNSADADTTITLLEDVTISDAAYICGIEGSTENCNVTMKLNGHTISGGAINIGKFVDAETGISRENSGRLIIEGDGDINGSVVIWFQGTLDLRDWTGDSIQTVNLAENGGNFISTKGEGTVNEFCFGGNTATQVNVSLYSGKYGIIKNECRMSTNDITLGNLLTIGYIFKKSDGSFYKNSETFPSGTYIDGISVVKCPHNEVTADKEKTTAGVTCNYCGKTGLKAMVGTTDYYDVDSAVNDWLTGTVDGTLKLYADGGSNFDFANASGKSLVIDLNGYRINNDYSVNLNGVKLTILDSRYLLSSNSAFGPITADSGTLILEDGYIQGLAVPEDSSAKISLKGGKVKDINCPFPIFNLFDDGYGINNGNLTVDPTIVLPNNPGACYNVINSEIVLTNATKEGSTSFCSGTIPFDLALKTYDTDIGRIEFRWYCIRDKGKTVLPLIETYGKDIKPDAKGVYYYDITTDGSAYEGWKDLTVNKIYNVICVVTGKESDGAYCWQTTLTGYKLKITPASIENADIAVENPTYNGTEQKPKITVKLGQKMLTEGTDYTVSDNAATEAGTYKLTVTGIGNYCGEAKAEWKVLPYKLSDTVITDVNKQYDGTDAVNGNFISYFTCVEDNFAVELVKDTDYRIVNAHYNSANAGADRITYKIELLNRNFAFDNGSTVKEFVSDNTSHVISISKADAPTVTEIASLAVTNNHANTYTVELPALPTQEAPKNYGEIAYTVYSVNLNDGYYTDGATVKDGKLILPVNANPVDTTGSIGTVTVKAATTNYEDIILTVNVSATDKVIPTGAPTLSKNVITYGEKLSDITLSGEMKDGGKAVPGTFSWQNADEMPNAGKHSAEWHFVPTDGGLYLETSGTVTITVNKATPTGEPKYNAVATDGKKLSDAALTVDGSTFSVPGTVQWVDDNGNELPANTDVKANTAYRWKFTPNDTANYNELTGSITLYYVSYGGGSSGGYAKTKVEIITNPDGSVTRKETKPNGTVIQTTTGTDGSITKTETKKDGSSLTEINAADGSVTIEEIKPNGIVIQTTTDPDGSITKTEIKQDGSSLTEINAADGSTGTIRTDANGMRTEINVKLGDNAVEDAKKSGEAVKVPAEVKAGRNSNSAPTINIELPEDAGKTRIEIPVSNVNSGTVAIIVHVDGTEEIIKDSVPTETGIQLTIDGSTTVKIVDNSKDFTDTKKNWAKDSIAFVSARELVNGINASEYAPNAPATRAQIWTILARQAGADLTGGSNWYEKAQSWAKIGSISDGKNPDAIITRAQMVTMLWRAAGSPVIQNASVFTDVAANSYYAQAVAWASMNGITSGTGNGKFSPNEACTRAQIAAFLHRVCMEKSNNPLINEN